MRIYAPLTERLCAGISIKIRSASLPTFQDSHGRYARVAVQHIPPARLPVRVINVVFATSAIGPLMPRLPTCRRSSVTVELPEGNFAAYWLRTVTLIPVSVRFRFGRMIQRNVGKSALGRYLSHSKTIHVFRCDGTALFALTGDRTGQILPSQIDRPIIWNFERSITLQLDKADQGRESTRATLSAIAKHGFYLMHAAVPSLIQDLACPSSLGGASKT